MTSGAEGAPPMGLLAGRVSRSPSTRAKLIPARHVALSLMVALSATATMLGPAGARPSDLWQVIHSVCLPNQQLLGHPWPCAEVNLTSGVESGYAVVSDKTNKTQVIVAPTVQIAGIESPSLLTPGAPNYWEAAWQSRSFVEQRAGRSIPRDKVGLAINSKGARTESQLHIHIDCLRPDVRHQLAINQSQIQAGWSQFALRFAGHRYLVMKVAADTLEDTNPFRLLAELPSARLDMGHQTLVAAGAIFEDGAPGFYFLASHADDAGNLGHGEELLDHQCAVLAQD